MKQFYYGNEDKERNHHQEQISIYRLFEYFEDDSISEVTFKCAALLLSITLELEYFGLLINVNQIASR